MPSLRIAHFCAVSVDGHDSVFHRDRLVRSSNGADKVENVLVRGFDNERLDTAGVLSEAIMGVRPDGPFELMADIHHSAFNLWFVVSKYRSDRCQYAPVLVVALLI